YLKMGRLGPVLVEIPNDVAVEEFPAAGVNYTPVKRTVSGANARDIEEAAKILLQAKSPVIIAGQGVLYAEATDELTKLAELLQAVKDLLGGKSKNDGTVAAEIKKGKAEWMAEWMPKLTSNEKPLNPYRIMWEFMNLFDRKECIVTHDAGSPRNQLVPFYQAPTPRSYIG